MALSARTAEYTNFTKECPGYDDEQSDIEGPVMLEVWGMQGSLLLPSLSGPLWPGMVAPDTSYL